MKVRIPSNMGGGNNNLANFQKQAKQIQEKFESAMSDLEEKKYESSSGGSMVKCVASGKMEILSLDFDKKIIESNDVTMLQDLIIAAINDVLNKIKEDKEKTTEQIYDGKLPSGLF